MGPLQDFIANGVFVFILTFVRIGTAATIMPGLGDSFTPQNIRLYIALAFSAVLTPLVLPLMPSPIPEGAAMMVLVVMEFIIGLFIGTVARILMMALDTAGMIISFQSGLGNAQLFNPALATQGSIFGAFLSVVAVMVLLAAKLHYLLFYGLVDSYRIFPVGQMPDTGSMADLIARTVEQSFLIGTQIAAPFIIVGMVMYIGMGVLTRLMPQMQVFMIAIPVQIWLALMTLAITLSSAMLFWANSFEEGMVYFLKAGGG